MIRAICCVSAVGLACGSTLASNALPNGSFEFTGPLGSLVTTNSGGGGQSAAADWFTFRPVDTDITTELLTSTDTLAGGGGNMLRLTTRSGFNGSAANGVFCNLLWALNDGDTASIDLLVEKDVTFLLGFVGSSGGFAAPIVGVGNGVWTRYDLTVSGGPVGSFGIEITSGQGGTVFLDNAVAVPAPAGMALLAVTGLVATRRRR